MESRSVVNEYLRSDVMLGVKNDLISKVEKRNDPQLPDGACINGPWHLMICGFRLRPGSRQAPRPMMSEAE